MISKNHKKPDYYCWIQRAKANLALLKGKQRNWVKTMSADDINQWAHNEYIRHFGKY